jgi:hypothetical protein
MLSQAHFRQDLGGLKAIADMAPMISSTGASTGRPMPSVHSSTSPERTIFTGMLNRRSRLPP